MVGGIAKLKITAFDLIADWGKYDVRERRDDQLSKEWNWICAFYKGLKQGMEIFITYNGKKVELNLEMLMSMATMIVREGLGRGLDFHPRNMGRDALELYNEVLDKMDKGTHLEEQITEGRLDELVLPGMITELGDDELDALRRKIHTVWEEKGSEKDDEDAINRNIIVNNEFIRRGREIPDQDELDKICEEWTKIAVHMIERGNPLRDFEYLLHHIEIDDQGKEQIHHCYFYDHIANLFEQDHLLIKDGKAYLDRKQITDGLFHIIKGLEPTQEIAWSDDEAVKGKVRPKKMSKGMSLKQKAKEW